MPEPKFSDKLPLSEFVEAVASQVAAGVKRFEAAHPEWEVGALSIEARVGFKIEPGPPAVVWVDLDEPERLLTLLPIPVRRKAE